MADSRWTCEAVNVLKELIEKRHSASVIADELTSRLEIEFSRNMVAGKIHRLEMGKKQVPIVSRKSGPPKVNSPKLSPPHNVFKLHDDGPVESLKLDITQLDSTGTRNMCRFPHRDEKGKTTYCGLPTGGSNSWCPYHHELATQPVRARISW